MYHGYASSKWGLLQHSQPCIPLTGLPCLLHTDWSPSICVVQLKNLQVLAMGDKTGTLRSAVTGQPPQVRLLAKVQELRLLSKAEKAGLLTLAENLGVTLTTIERLGILSKAESSGALSAAVNPQTPGALLTIALVLLLVGPAAVFLIPEDNLPEVVVQIVLATTCIAGGAAAFGGSKLVKALQEA